MFAENQTYSDSSVISICMFGKNSILFTPLNWIIIPRTFTRCSLSYTVFFYQFEYENPSKYTSF